MNSGLFGTLHRIARNESTAIRTTELAIVQEIHPHADEQDHDNYACTIALRDTGIVLKRVPVATSRIGAVAIPAIGELVLVQFIGGNVNAPIITGSLYNDQDRPPLSDDGTAVLHLPPGASEGDGVRLEIRSIESPELNIDVGSAVSIKLRDDDPVLTLDADGGSAVITIDRDGTISIESSADLNVKSANVKIEAQNELTLEAGGSVNVKGATINLN